jgi:hypothetical protein
MSATQMQTDDIEKFAKVLELKLKPGNSQSIASMLTEIRESVYRKASSLRQDAPLSIFFDAR